MCTDWAYGKFVSSRWGTEFVNEFVYRYNVAGGTLIVSNFNTDIYDFQIKKNASRFFEKHSFLFTIRFGMFKYLSWCIPLFRCSKTFCYFIPVNHVPEGGNVIRSSVLIMQVIGMLPDITAQDRCTFNFGDIHKRIVLIWG